MSTPLIAQEIYLLERYSSLAYFGRMRDAFAACVKAAEDALAEFTRHLPADYRKRPLYDQPDVVWGERVIPNSQWALRGLNDGYAVLAQEDADALGMAGNVDASFAAINRDYSCEWMPSPFKEAFDHHWLEASLRSFNISITQQGNWAMHDLTSGYRERDRGPLDAPESWPTYRLNQAVRVRTDDKVPRNGVYVSDADNGCAQFLIEGYEAWPVVMLADPANTTEEQRVPTTWTLVERVADSGGGLPGQLDSAVSGEVRLRCESTHPCPQTGYWHTPAQAGSRRRFEAGELMPELGSGWGTTIWQWDENQQA